jgi:hypothetical protein
MLLAVNDDATAAIALRLVYDMVEDAAHRSSSNLLEVVADYLVTWNQRRGHGSVETGQIALGLAYRSYSDAFEADDRRAGVVAAKASSLRALLAKFGTEAGRVAPDEAPDQEQELDLVALGCLAAVDGRPAPDDRIEQGAWKADALRTLLRIARAAADRDVHLATLLCRWIRKQASDFSVRVAVCDAPIESELDPLEEHCLLEVAALEDRMGLPWASFDATEQAAFAAAYSPHRRERAPNLARASLAQGDRLLQSITGEPPKTKDDPRLGLVDRLYKLSRLTRDIDEIVCRLDRLCDILRSLGQAHERAEECLEAAEIYSNLGYRYFSGAEQCGLSRHYLLSVYFFEKAEFFRALAPGGGYASIDTQAPNAPELGYRRFESDGFIFGASAKLTEGIAIISLFDSAAQAHERAGKMVFGQLGLHALYNSAAHHFNAQASLIRAARAGSANEAAHYLRQAAMNVHECFQLFKSIYRQYEHLLNRLTENKDDPCPDEMVRELELCFHPSATRLQSTARAVSKALTKGDPPDTTCLSLARELVFLNPLG